MHFQLVHVCSMLYAPLPPAAFHRHAVCRYTHICIVACFRYFRYITDDCLGRCGIPNPLLILIACTGIVYWVGGCQVERSFRPPTRRSYPPVASRLVRGVAEATLAHAGRGTDPRAFLFSYSHFASSHMPMDLAGVGAAGESGTAFLNLNAGAASRIKPLSL